MSEFQDALLVISRQPALIEKSMAFFLAQVPEGDDPHEILPTDITLPGGIGWVAACKDGENSIGELRQEGRA